MSLPFQIINSTDKLQSGFRAKFNANVALLITDIVDNGDATATVYLQGGTNFVVDLGTSFYTKLEVVTLLAGVPTATWGGITGNVEDQTDVVGNLGIIEGIDDVLISCNFAVEAGEPDNPFGAYPASGYASFSVPGIAGTGWQLLVKESTGNEIKFRTYFSGVWHDWSTIQAGGDPIEETIPSGVNYTYSYDGRFGTNPTAYVQQQITDGWQINSAMINIMNNGDIVALGDFSDGGVYRLVVKG